MIRAVLFDEATKQEQVMKPTDQADLQTYRLIVVRREGSEILLSSTGSGWSLPCVRVLPRKRLAQQLVTEFNGGFGLQAYCLFFPSFLATDRNGYMGNYAVLECIEGNGQAPNGNCWIPCNGSLYPLTQSIEDNSAINESLCELASYANQSKAGPFGRPGWIQDLFSWAEEQLGPLGLRVSGNFQQLNGSPTFSLIRLETNGPGVWFKATGEPNRHELPITVALTRLFPKYLPAILGVHPSWNGWLSEEISDTTLDQIAELCAWERVAKDLAELQIASIGNGTELLTAGCKDLRLRNLVDLIAPFFSRIAEFMAAQQKQTPPPLTDSQLLFLANRLTEWCSLLHELRLPNTLGHIDFNLGNILLSPTRSVFLDWAEGCVTNPLVTFEYLLEHLRRSDIHGAAVTERITAAYLRPWEKLLPIRELGRGMAVSPGVAVFVYAVAGKSWRSPQTLHNSRRSGYLRSLTRRMYREATRAAGGSNQCVA
jgi:hypothetical protein